MKGSALTEIWVPFGFFFLCKTIKSTWLFFCVVLCEVHNLFEPQYLHLVKRRNCKHSSHSCISQCYIYYIVLLQSHEDQKVLLFSVVEYQVT